MKLFGKKPRLEWKAIASKGGPKKIFFRTPVPGGWLISTAEGESLTFLPDSDHRWNGDSLPFIED